MAKDNCTKVSGKIWGKLKRMLGKLKNIWINIDLVRNKWEMVSALYRLKGPFLSVSFPKTRRNQLQE